MASEIDIFSLYKHKDNFFLLKTVQASYSNASQIEEDIAVEQEVQKRKWILQQIQQLKQLDFLNDLIFVGEYQGYPMGDVLYQEKGNVELSLFYMETAHGFPWIVLGHTESENEFLTELYEDDDFDSLQPIGHPKHIKALFFTENDF